MKFVFLLCLLIASSCQASPMPAKAGMLDKLLHKIDEMKDSILSMISNAIDTFKEKADKISDEMYNTAMKIRDKGIEIVNGLLYKIDKRLAKIDERIKQLTGEADGVDITECTQMASEIRKTGLSMIANSTECVSDKIEQATGYVESITDAINEVYLNLTIISEEAKQCTQNIDGIQAAAKALVCLGTASKDATVTAVSRVPTVLKNMMKMCVFIGTLVPSLAVCTTTTSFATFLETSDAVLHAVESCVQEKINDAKGITVH